MTSEDLKPPPPYDSPMAEGTTELLSRLTLMLQRRGLMQTTVNCRLQKLHMLAKWLYPRGLLEAEREDIERFLDERNHSAKTRYDYLSHIGMFYKAMIEDGRITTDPTAFIHRPRMRPGLPRPISDDDLANAIAQAPPVTAAALILAAYQGLRAMEIANLQREDIVDTNDPPMLHVVKGKGGRDRVLPLHPEVMPALRRAGMPKFGKVLRRPRGGGYPPARLSQQVNEYLDSIGVDATLHQIRHWFGTKTYQSTNDLRLVQALLGHASVLSTAVYAQYAIEGAQPAITSLKVPRRQTLADHDDPRELSA